MIFRIALWSPWMFRLFILTWMVESGRQQRFGKTKTKPFLMVRLKKQHDEVLAKILPPNIGVNIANVFFLWQTSKKNSWIFQITARPWTTIWLRFINNIFFIWEVTREIVLKFLQCCATLHKKNNFQNI